MIDFDCADIENMWVKINTSEGSLLICNIYRPPDNNDFWDSLNDNIEYVKNESKDNNIIILGDLNSDFTTVNGKKLLNFCISNNFLHHINESTRITDSTSSCLDQIISNIPNFVSKVFVDAPVSTNDHSTVGVKLKFNLVHDRAYNRTMWQYNQADRKGFINAINNSNWNECFIDNDVDATCNAWNEKFMNIASQYIPHKKVLIRPNDRPWFTSELRKMRRKVIRLYDKAKTKQNDYHWSNYKNFNKEYHLSLDQAESKYYERLNISLRSEKNTRGWWSTIKSIIGRGNDESYPPIYNPQADNYAYESKDKASLFNNFFLSHSNIDTTNAKLPNDNHSPCELLTSLIVQECEVEDLLNSLDCSKSTGCDNISPKLLKLAGNSIVSPLTSLFNFCIENNQVPHIWKQAHVIPLHKKGDRDTLNNYRPVSILPIVSKIFERILFKHIYNFFRDNNILTKHQSGFQPQDSTVNQLSYLYHTFCEALDHKKDIQIIFCDISKAFDRVWHEGLLYKLKRAGIQGDLLLLLTDYLKGRQQRVLVRGQTSQWGDITAGVPQGSVLGPLLFLVYINDIVDNITCKVKLFADDTILYVTLDNLEESAAILNANLKVIQEWADQWLVTFNPNKTKLLNVSNRKNVNFDNHPIMFDDVKCEPVKQQKHLGVIFDDKLKWTFHVDDIVKSVAKMGDVLLKLKSLLDRKTLEIIYMSFIRPKLEYASIIWDDCTEMDKIRLENTQLKFARIVSGAKRGTSHKAIYDELGWVTLADRRKASKTKFIFNVVNKRAPDYLCELLPKTVNACCNRDLRNNGDLRNIKTRTEKYRRSIFPHCIRLWNDLPNSVKTNDKFNYKYDQDIVNQTVPQFKFGNTRKLGIIHSQLRMKCSNLNSDLFNLHVVDNPYCVFCHNCIEDRVHFFLSCPLYNIQRIELFENLHLNCEIDNIDIDTLLFGKSDCSDYANMEICKLVEKYISDSQRFT